MRNSDDSVVAASIKAADAWANNEDPTPYLRQCAIGQLQRIRESAANLPINYVRVIASTGHTNGCCIWCRAHNNKLYSLESELESPHLPVEGCECYNDSAYCTCYYEVVFDDEL